MFLAGTPTHRVRQVILEHSTAVSVVGPMHIVSTLIFFIGIVLRIFALEMRASLRLVYMVPLSTAFLFAKGWAVHTLAVATDWGLHKKAWQEAVGGETAENNGPTCGSAQVIPA